MYKKEKVYKRVRRQIKPRPAFIQEINRKTTPEASSAFREFVISMNGEQFYLVRSLSSRSAVEMVMGIGANPDPSTSPPPSPGKRKRKSGYKARVWKFSRENRAVVPISKADAIRMVNKQINNYSLRLPKRK